MAPYRRLSILLVAATLGLLLCVSANAAEQPQEMDNQAQAPGANPANGSAADNEWHLVVAPYLWFPGVHGTVGARGRNVSMHAGAADLLSHFRFGLMGAGELSRKRLLLPLDVVWVRLGDDKALPFTGLGAISADAKLSEFILTPKIGFRVIGQERFKIDALAGFRYWHLGQNLKFNPSLLGLNFSASQNWVDPLVGGRILATFSPKLEVTLAGDVGGWGAGSQLEYQAVGLLGYKVKPNWTLQAGYRYLDVNYRNGGSILDAAMGGVVFGITIKFW